MNIKQIKFSFLFISVFVLSYCKKTQQFNNDLKIDFQKQEVFNFDNILKCSDYSYNDNYFYTADYGCIYAPNGTNNIGNIIVYLIPKNKRILYNETETNIETQRINGLSNEKLKEEFDIYIFLISKEYLVHNDVGDPIYYQKNNYKEQLYTYKNNKWELVDYIDINEDDDIEKEQKWRERIIENYAKSQISITNNIQTFRIPKGYYIHESEEITTNNVKYKIIVLEKEEKKNNRANWHFELPIIILKNNRIQIAKNERLLYKFNDNCPAEGFQGIVSKNNYFTIQQISCRDFLFVISYITFKIDSSTNNIILHKYGEEYTDRSDPDKDIPSKIWTSKDFGVVKFEDVNEEFLIALRNKE